MRNILLSLLCLLAALSGQAGTACFSYAYPDAESDVTGTGKAHAYDVAIKLDGATFAGSKVKAISVPLSSSGNITDVKVWLTKKLALSNSENAPDICSYAATTKDGMLTFTFPTPVTIDADGLFAGYSFNVFAIDKETSEPIQVVATTATTGLYIHAGTTWRSWTQVGRVYKIASKMAVTLEGDYADNDMALSDGDVEITADLREPMVDVPVKVANMGSYGPKKLEFSYAFNGGARTDLTMQVDAPNTLYGQANTIALPLVNSTIDGLNTLDIKLEKINGVTNANAASALSVQLYGVSEYPENRPLIEEYTGLWCSYCPRGFAAMEYMSRLYPQQWVGVAWHGDDAMSIMRTSQFPNLIETYPNTMINRRLLVDPYYGTSEDGAYTIEADWLKAREEFTPIHLSVEAWRSDADRSVIEAHASVRAVRPLQGDYRILYYLVADGISNDNWVQLNSYAGSNPANYSIPEMKQFCQGTGYMTGLSFSDVLAMTSDVKGVAGSLPAQIEKGVDYKHEFDFATAGVTNLKGYDLIGPAKSLRVVAAVVDYATNTIVNSAECKVQDKNGVADAVNAAEVVSRRYYDLQGRPTSAERPGLKLVRTIMSDGTILVSKIK